jgi:hypothetical protein
MTDEGDWFRRDGADNLICLRDFAELSVLARKYLNAKLPRLQCRKGWFEKKRGLTQNDVLARNIGQLG